MLRFLCLQLWSLAIVHARLSGTPEESLASCQSDRSNLEARIRELETMVEGTAYHAESLSGLKISPEEPTFWYICAMVFVVILTQSLANGLTMGLVSLDPLELAMIAKKKEVDITDPKDRKQLKDDQEAATRVLPIIHDHHLLMVTVLLVNCLCGEVLPLFLDRLVPSWLSLLLSVTLVLMFSEVIPSAIFTGPKQLMLAACFSPLVVIWRTLFWPIAFPIARLLDFLLGNEHKGRYNFADLKALVALHAKGQVGGEDEAIFKSFDSERMGIITTEKPHKFNSNSAVVFVGSDEHEAVSNKLIENEVYYVKKCKPLHGRNLDCTFQLYRSEDRRDLISFSEPEDLESGVFRLQERDEIKISQGAMQLSQATVWEHMQRDDAITLDKVYMVEASRDMDAETLKEIEQKGHSRVIIYEGNQHNVRGFILTKQLITLYAGKESSAKSWVKVSSLNRKPLILARPEEKMLDMLNKFQEERLHIALVTNNPNAVEEAWTNGTPIPPHVHMVGIITLEDVIERLLQEKIDDEFDDNHGQHVASGGALRPDLGAVRSQGVRRTSQVGKSKTLGPVKIRSESWSHGESVRDLSDPLLP